MPVSRKKQGKLAGDQEEVAAMKGLMRMGPDESMEAMITVTKSQYDKRAAASAKEFLRQNASRIRDPIIRGKVLDGAQ